MSARISPVDPAAAEGRVRQQFDSIQKTLGVVPNLMKTMAHSPALLEGYLGLSSALAKGALRPAVREQLALAVGQVNGCEYCLSAHAYYGARARLTPEQIQAAREGEAEDPKAQAALTLALDLIDRRGDVSDEQLAQAREAGLSDAEIAEVVGHVALSTLTNYFNQLAQTEVDYPRVPVSV
jgi:uncharacterized peroxidase-related enzyme